MTLEELRPLYEAMLAADREYKRAEPDVVHIAHAALKARRFAFNRAAGEYVVDSLEAKP
jgi:hypothetical protein